MLFTILYSQNFKIFVLIMVGVLLLGYAILIYNNLIRLKNNIDKAWANIDVLLKQRHDELAKLVKVCQQYMEYEQETLKIIVLARNRIHQARGKHQIHRLNRAEGQYRQAIKQLFAHFEDYPALQAQQNFTHLQKRVSELETNLADRREFYNESITQYNIRIKSIPDFMIASLMKYKEENMLQFASNELTEPTLFTGKRK